MKRFFSFFVVLATMISALPIGNIPVAQAEDSSWQWSDISDYLSYRNNRPIWAMAHANSGWYFTDGLDLWNGGQVYRFDGTTSVTMTTDVRNAGLNRVDDIVSDGADTVVFLQDVVRYDRQFKIVVNKNGSYFNVTELIRGMLYSDEGISQIQGKNGDWMLLTTKGRLFLWNANLSAPTQITFPSGVQSLINTEFQKSNAYETNLLYPINDENAIRSIDLEPINDSQWLIRVLYNKHSFCLNGVCDSTYYSKWYVVSDNGVFTDVSSKLPQDHYTAILDSNGSEALIINSDLFTTSLFSFNGTTVTSQKSTQGLWSIHSAEWTGQSWMFMQGYKTVYQYIPASGYLIAYPTRDYFVTGASDHNGHLLLGGVVSALGNPSPIFPLVSKLVSISENGSSIISNPTDTTTQTDENTGIHSWEWLDPETPDISTNQEVTYHVGAWDNEGLMQIDIYVNGVSARSCLYPSATGNQECSSVIYANSHAQGTSIFVNAKITSVDGQIAWTDGETIWRNTDSGNTTTNTDSQHWSTIWLSPEVSSMDRHDSTTFSVQAQDTVGIERITIFVNGIQRQNCYPNTTSKTECTYRIDGDDYQNGTSAYVNARMINTGGTEYWSDARTIWINEDSNDSSTSSFTSTGWIDGQTTIANGETTVFRSSSYSSVGLSRVEIYVNNSARHTCYYNNALESVSCDHQIYEGDYSGETSLKIQSRAIDENGNSIWSKSVYVTRSVSDSNNDTDDTDDIAEINAWEWLEPETALAIGDETEYSVGSWSGAGIKSASIFVNGVEKRTCYFYRSSANRTCTTNLRAQDYGLGTELFVNALVTDYLDRQEWTDGVQIDINEELGDESNNANGWISVSTNRDDAYSAGNSVTITATGGDDDGVSSIEIYANGTRVRTCRNATSCTYWTKPSSSDARFNYKAILYDVNGNWTSTGYKQIVRDL